ncbi:MAG TPA: cation:proton antiporter [Pyrinomonadaceae bacterium]|jgi:Kef-type K+ transport system membrane component KefB|nr:cation:proton antiporter [Pyrinomonadaceae bacterium]
MKARAARTRSRATKLLLLTTAALSAVALSSWFGATARAASGDEGPVHGLAPFVLLSVALMLLVAKLGGELFVKAGQPAVLGELVGGILLGSLSLFGVAWVEQLRADAVVAALAEIGVIILLFEVGLESNLGEMRAVGVSSLLVATLGVVAPFFLGWGVAAYFLPAGPTLAHVFIGATLCATSVGITARVLRDTGKLQTREASIILGAAVLDDVMGLLILAVVAGAIRAAGAGQALAVWDVAVIALKSLAFLVGAIVVGQYVVPHLFRGAARMQSRGVLVTSAVAFCFLLAWAAGVVGLAPIVGAFAAGLVLDEIHFEDFVVRGEQRVAELLAPVSALLVPVFFVLMGLKVDLRAFARVEILGFAAVLTLVAILGKQACSLGVVGRGVNRLAVGLGMIPRGEVGLIFAGIGATLWLPGPEGARVPVVDAATFGAVVIMVLVTTLVTPPALKWAMKNNDEVGGLDGNE